MNAQHQECPPTTTDAPLMEHTLQMHSKKAQRNSLSAAHMYSRSWSRHARSSRRHPRSSSRHARLRAVSVAVSSACAVSIRSLADMAPRRVGLRRRYLDHHCRRRRHHSPLLSQALSHTLESVAI